MKLDHTSPEVSSASQISEAQLAANRANAKLAHGATTQAGRKASSMNAIRHGLTSKMALLPGENAEHFEQLVASHVERHAPVGDEENELVHLIAENAWRMLKIAPERAAIYDMGRLENPDLFKEIDEPIRRAALIDAKIGCIYETRLRNLNLLERSYPQPARPRLSQTANSPNGTAGSS